MLHCVYCVGAAVWAYICTCLAQMKQFPGGQHPPNNALFSRGSCVLSNVLLNICVLQPRQPLQDLCAHTGCDSSLLYAHVDKFTESCFKLFIGPSRMQVCTSPSPFYWMHQSLSIGAPALCIAYNNDFQWAQRVQMEVLLLFDSCLLRALSLHRS